MTAQDAAVVAACVVCVLFIVLDWRQRIRRGKGGGL